MNRWLEQVFEAEIVGRGGIVRRRKRDVQKYASRTELLEVAKRNGFHLIETGNQYIVICNPGELRIWC